MNTTLFSWVSLDTDSSITFNLFLKRFSFDSCPEPSAAAAISISFIFLLSVFMGFLEFPWSVYLSL